jgi:hypothetical protein
LKFFVGKFKKDFLFKIRLVLSPKEGFEGVGRDLGGSMGGTRVSVPREDDIPPPPEVQGGLKGSKIFKCSRFEDSGSLSGLRCL